MTHSIEAMRRARQEVADGFDVTWDAASITILEDAITELAALRAWRERAVPLLRALVGDRLIDINGSWRCCLCGATCAYGATITHAASCQPITLARVLLAESEASDA